ncbi:SRPBCC family protein [Myceligenerans pegani]|uniref:SRPBCC family protein n=1 Tax=Myceligenerans pegani TaxID=2776917 RepID=A0ABR9MUI4_9MICO|nr:SRPBCC family protein [Myceligenerans sp. TRM 65318]MBE1874553.1 SRPBCC family protein [Myceligenerans sp. TRM 65318]MBE3016824.1 SRPBCC family protein [Myceligenerans sp. TRM 65318]
MHIAIDPATTAGLVTREVRTGERDGEPTRIAVARRRYDAERADVWDAVTTAERLPRWFAPVTGELRLGGRYQIEGNASGTVESCVAPESFGISWEFGGGTSWVTVSLTEADGGTVLELTHESVVDPEFWTRFGPGAVGVGWDLTLMGLGLHLTTGEESDPAEAERWSVGPQGKEFVRAAADDWARAAIADGDDEAAARAAADATLAFYTTPPEA